MMTATERVVTQLNARRVRDDEYRARCPVHQGKSDTSLSIKRAGDRVLIHCHHGCKLSEVLGALGMKSAAELFDTSTRTKPDPEAERQARIRRGLIVWRDEQIQKHAEKLRERDGLIRFARQVSDYCAVEGIDESLRDLAVRDLLADAYIGNGRLYCVLEYEFEQLLRANSPTLELYREIA